MTQKAQPRQLYLKVGFAGKLAGDKLKHYEIYGNNPIFLSVVKDGVTTLFIRKALLEQFPIQD